MTASIAECEIRTGSSNLSETGSSLNDSESEDESFIELDADSILSYLDDDNLLIDVDNGKSIYGIVPKILHFNRILLAREIFMCFEVIWIVHISSH